MSTTSTCQTCAHLDASEEVPEVRAGYCTYPVSWFDGKPVPAWLSGCPDYQPVTGPQGDGDSGGCDAVGQ
jgi:hypothetical protein